MSRNHTRYSIVRYSNDEEAMDLIRLLREKGYEADEVYNAMKDRGS
jgi:hypothetical protein